MSHRLLSLFVCLGLIPCIVGCVDDIKANNANQSEERAKTNASSLDSPKKERKTPLEFSELPVNDPLVANAIQAREQIAEIEEELLQQLDDLRAALASAKAEPERLRESVEQFLEITKTMRQKTQEASVAINLVNERTVELSRSSRHLASSYRALAELFRNKARDYSEKKLREQLLGFAKDYDAVAASIPERCRALDSVQKKLPSLRRKVKEVNAFLNDAVSFLNSHPSINTETREKYSAEFESFAVTFSEWIRTLDDLRSALRERAISKVIQESYRQEVVAFQKLEAAKREEIAKAEQAKRDEEMRLAKLAAMEQEKLNQERERLAKEREELARERERLAKAEPAPSSSAPNPVVVPVGLQRSVVYSSQPCPPPCYCPSVRSCRFRLFPLFRRG